MPRLFFKLYYAGLNNCRMSLDIGVALAHLTGRTLVPYNVRPPWSSHPILRRGTHYSVPATILDLFDLPVAVNPAHAGKEEIKLPGLRSLLQAAVYDSVLRVEPAPPVECDDFQAFRNRRHHVGILNDRADQGNDLIVDVPTLGMYSYFLYADDSRRSDLRRILSQVRARKPYRDFAERIARTLAPFNAVHIRRGDFLYAGCSPRSGQVTCEEVANNLASRLSVNDRLVVCTDTSRDDWFAPLRNRFRDVVFLDRLLLESHPWRGEFAALPYHDDVVLGLVTQLVAAQAGCFVGTLYSSFSALIQRLRGFERRTPEFLFCYSDWEPALVPFKRCEFVPVQDGPYSWNRILYPVNPHVTSWLRDWPESFQEVSATPALGVASSRTVLLRASEARVHGHTARYERSLVHDNIGYWTNPSDVVTWDFSVPQRMVYRVEIRYACTDACAGSTFIVGLGQDKSITAKVAATGDWVIFSSWQTLGMMDISAGRHVLFVRALAMPSTAVMNLAGIRLVPVH